jgi:hypothetical protein
MDKRLSDLKHLENMYKEQQRKRLPPPSLYSKYLNKSMVTSPLELGNKIVQNIRKLLDTSYRSPAQVEMHEIMIKCCIRVIYGNETVDKYSEQICESNGWNDIRQEHIFIAFRRFGKTEGVVMFSVAAALSIPNVEISIFSTGARASGNDGGMIGKVKERLKKQYQIKPFRDNEEHIYIKMSDTDIRKINAYPGSVHT